MMTPPRQLVRQMLTKPPPSTIAGVKLWLVVRAIAQCDGNTLMASRWLQCTRGTVNNILEREGISLHTIHYVMIEEEIAASQPDYQI